VKSWTAFEIMLLIAVWVAATTALSGFLELSRRRPDVAFLAMAAMFAALWVCDRRRR